MTAQLALYLALCVGGTLGAALIIGRKRLLDFRGYGWAFMAIMAMTYVVRPLLAFTIDGNLRFLETYFPGSSAQVLQDMPALAGLYFASMIFFAIGYRLVRRPTPSRAAACSPAPARTDGLLLWYSVTLIVVGYASYLFAKGGFIGIRASSTEYVRHAGGTTFGNTTGYVEMANYLVVSGALLLFATSHKLWLAALVSAPWAVNQIYTGWSRYMVFNLVVGVAVIYLAANRGARLLRGRTLLVACIVAAALVLFVGMRGRRDFMQRSLPFGSALRTTLSLPVEQIIGDFAGFEGTWYTVRRLGSSTPRYGTGILYRLVVLPIPRLLWPDKPLSPEFTWGYILNARSSNFWRSGAVSSNYGLSIWYNTAVKGAIGYALEEWGWAGVAINFTLTGLFLALIEKGFAARSHYSRPWCCIYAATYAMIVLLGRNAVYDFLITYILIFYLPYALAHTIVSFDRALLAWPSRREGSGRVPGLMRLRLRYHIQNRERAV